MDIDMIRPFREVSLVFNAFEMQKSDFLWPKNGLEKALKGLFPITSGQGIL
jgi:hypothetical protein